MWHSNSQTSPIHVDRGEEREREREIIQHMPNVTLGNLESSKICEACDKVIFLVVLKYEPCDGATFDFHVLSN